MRRLRRVRQSLQDYFTIYKRVPSFLREVEAFQEPGTYDRLINNSYKISLHAENSMRGMTARLTGENGNN